jgi:hypothetical protein
VQASVCAWHVHTDFDVRRTSRTFSGKALLKQSSGNGVMFTIQLC